jgi:hypothetical protein
MLFCANLIISFYVWKIVNKQERVKGVGSVWPVIWCKWNFCSYCNCYWLFSRLFSQKTILLKNAVNMPAIRDIHRLLFWSYYQLVSHELLWCKWGLEIWAFWFYFVCNVWTFFILFYLFMGKASTANTPRCCIYTLLVFNWIINGSSGS